jgi:hypothetical protein
MDYRTIVTEHQQSQERKAAALAEKRNNELLRRELNAKAVAAQLQEVAEPELRDLVQQVGNGVVEKVARDAGFPESKTTFEIVCVLKINGWSLEFGGDFDSATVGTTTYPADRAASLDSGTAVPLASVTREWVAERAERFLRRVFPK